MNRSQDVPQLISELNEPLKMRFAADVLAWIDDERAIDAVIDAIQYDDHQVRESAFNGLRREGKLVANRLLHALHHKNSLIRQFALEVLGEIKEPFTSNAIVEVLLTETDYHVRQAAIEALGKIGDSAAVSHLTPFLTHENKFVRWRCVQALGRIGTDNALDAIRPLVQDPDKDVSNEAKKYRKSN